MPVSPLSAQSGGPAGASSTRLGARSGRRRRWPRRLAAGIALGILATSCGGWAVLHGIGSIDRVDAFGAERARPPADDASTTFLVVGTDEREGIPERTLKNVLHAGGESCHCTDTMMIVQLAGNGSRASVVSIPRDSYVDIPAHRDPANGRDVPAAKGKINAAYGLGGPQLTVATVEQNTGLRIDHYLQLNFAGFVSAVDAVGGVRVCTAKPLKDEYSGLDLPAGTSTLDGAGALKYVRARHVDGSADLGRMHRQQKVVAQLLHEVTNSGTLLNPVRLARVTDSLLGSVKADKGLAADDLVTLATRMKDLRDGRADFATVPLASVDHPVAGWGSTVLWDRARSRALFDAVREGRPLTNGAGGPGGPGGQGNQGGTDGAQEADGAGEAETAEPSAPAAPVVAPEQVHVQVFNAAGVPGLGARVDTELRRAGFATTGAPSNAPAGTAAGRTVIRYDPRWAESARTLAGAVPGAGLTPVPGLGATLQLYAGGDRPPASPSATAPAGATAAASGRATDGRTAGAVPASPPPAPSPGAGASGPAASGPAAEAQSGAATSGAAAERASDIICP
ncbi:LCP family protein [Kitasatospora sp. NPDC056327]|uniref:LCP family protein n=1 Tax=Kitasatospora sp. NPDC056327 TaxID=3345785 RepID=UPI0035DBA590